MIKTLVINVCGIWVYPEERYIKECTAANESTMLELVLKK